MRFFRLHLLTAIILQIEMGVLLWANTRAWVYPDDIHYVDGVPLDFSYRHGWPFDVGSYSYIQGKMVWLEKGIAFDLLVGVFCLTFTWLMCERLLYPRRAAKAESAS